MSAEHPTVLVAAGDTETRRRYREHLAGEYDVRTAATGTAALDAVAAGCRVVVLARELEDLSGEALLRRLEERGADPRVAMVSDTEPDFDIVDVPVDDFLVEPVDAARLREAVAHLLDLARYSDLLDDYYRTANKVATLESAGASGDLAGSEDFERLRTRAETLEAEVTDTLQDIDDYAAAFHQVEELPEVTGGDPGG